MAEMARAWSRVSVVQRSAAPHPSSKKWLLAAEKKEKVGIHERLLPETRKVQRAAAGSGVGNRIKSKKSRQVSELSQFRRPSVVEVLLRLSSQFSLLHPQRRAATAATAASPTTAIWQTETRSAHSELAHAHALVSQASFLHRIPSIHQSLLVVNPVSSPCLSPSTLTILFLASASEFPPIFDFACSSSADLALASCILRQRKQRRYRCCRHSTRNASCTA